MFPSMLDHYQIQLTRLLEAEQFGEAKKLLRFLLQCKGEDERHYEEWRNLLGWIEMAFPEGIEAPDRTDGDGPDERELRDKVLGAHGAENSDEAYVKQVLHVMRHHPLIEQQLLALERAVYLEGAEVDRTILDWLVSAELHPAVQFRALQALRRRGVTGKISFERLGETVELDVESTPLAMDEFPGPVAAILERVESVTEVTDSTLPHFARELWKECLQFLYATADYNRIIEGGEDTVDCWAAALHVNLLLAAYGTTDDEQIRDTYGIPESLRFRYEQASKAIRRIGVANSEPPFQP
ncbi:hypothetical protein BG53_15895 [Paenibacillus darwinianus]|uniref:Uncharacterized protein n=1 Tax=Paenibacillus darwinianus TaxID=1380763 RepID=A0A9W5W7B8_9BACL|nr:hypothetical protein BG53_15895 [Paenibacillus darwinianus]EXX90165.1 hypothetical protein BG52_13885 [Paenibacillus darwinianus]EXX91501.1 hypothetical protein CH50_13585 [Paenibacillus darwinianus]